MTERAIVNANQNPNSSESSISVDKLDEQNNAINDSISLGQDMLLWY